MSLTVSIANSIRFRPVGGEPFMFNNTRNNRLLNEGFTPSYPLTEHLIQAQSTTGDVVTCRAWYNNAYTDIAASPVVTLGIYDYTEFALNLALFPGDVFFEIISGTEVWRSELITVEPLNDEYLTLEWFNHENAFLMNYQTGIVPSLYVKASMDMAAPAGDVTVYENQGTQTNLKEIVQRVMQFETYVPDYMAELITVAMSHDRFFINEIEYVKAKKPSVEKQGNSNIYKLTAELTQKTVLGLNTHDTGFDVDGGTITTDIMNLQILGASVNHTLEIPAGYMLHSITAIWKEGTNVTLKAGTIALSDDIMESISLSAASANNLIAIHQDNPAVSTIFFTLTADAAPVPQIDIHVQLIKNRV